MINFQTFFSQDNGKPIEVVDPNNPDQCVDLVVDWLDKLGIPRLPNGSSVFPFDNAYQIFTDFGDLQAKYFQRIFNGVDNQPQEGDIVVWSYYFNYSGGHTGVASGKGQVSGTPQDWFECFVQNDPLGSPAHLKNYSFTDVLGWLRPYAYHVSPTQAQVHEGLALSHQQSALNETKTASEQNDMDFQANMKPIFDMAQEVLSYKKL